MKHEVQGYPTMKVFRKGESTEYRGARKADGIVSYMQKQAAPAITDLDSANFEEFKNSDRVIVVAYANDDASKAELKNIAEKMRDDFMVGLVADEALAKEHGVTQLPTVVVYKQFDEGRNDLEGIIDADKVEAFIKAHSIPLVDEIDASNFQLYAESGLPLAYLFSDDEDTLKTHLDVIKPFAEKYKGKMNFVYIDAIKYAGHAGNVGLKENFPAVAIQNLETGAKYPFDQSTALTAEKLEPFFADYLDGKIKATVKSAEIPADNNGPVKVVVADQFNELVLDKSKDVFLEVYAPWCGHCKNLEPIWTQLGEHLAKQGLANDILIAKMDGTENDIPEEGGFQVEGFPTLKYFKGGEAIDYDGDRSFDDLVKFLNEHNSKGVTIKAEEEAEEEAKESGGGNTHDEL
ncbi:thioredoxin-domain-containing protein [Backusella circina FSU 941]|nr:thioredoxin-domain-containing protein [Backusella circina FSU 941]